MMKEIPGFEGLYCACDDGTVYSLVQNSSRRKGPIKPLKNSCGYYRIQLFGKDGSKKRVFLHRLIAELFVPNPDGCEVVNHIDADISNNAADNLEWCTQRQNIAHSRNLGHQSKDRAVEMTNVVTGEVVRYPNIKTASVALYGNYWKLGYRMRTVKQGLHEGLWVIEIV